MKPTIFEENIDYDLNSFEYDLNSNELSHKKYFTSAIVDELLNNTVGYFSLLSNRLKTSNSLIANDLIFIGIIILMVLGILCICQFCCNSQCRKRRNK